MNTKDYEPNDYVHNLDLLIISHLMRVSYLARSGCIGKGVQVTHVYLMMKEFPNALGHV